MPVSGSTIELTGFQFFPLLKLFLAFSHNRTGLKAGSRLNQSDRSVPFLEAHTTIVDMLRFMHMTFYNALPPSKYKSRVFVMRAHGLDHTSNF